MSVGTRLEWAMAQVQRRRATAASIGAMMSSQMLTGVLMAAGSIVQGRFIAPEMLGYYGTFAILSSYLAFLHLGSLTSLQRDFPYWLGKGNPDRAKRAAAITQGWILLVCGFVAILFGILAAGSLFMGNYKAAAGWTVQLIIGCLSFYTLYLGCTYRSSHEFVTWSKIGALASVVSFLTLPFVALLGYWGLCIRGAVPPILNGLLLHRSRPVRVKPRIGFHELWAQIKFGLPMDMAGSLATSCVMATMSMLVVRNYGEAVLGLFIFAKSGEAVISQFALSIVQVFVPRINRQMGITDSFQHCARYTIRPTLVGTVVVVIVIGAASLLCGPCVRLLTPKFVQALPILRLFLWVGLCPVLLIPTHAMIAAKYTKPVLIGDVACFVVFCVIGGVATLLHLPPLSMAMAYAAGKMTLVVVGWVFLWLRLREQKKAPVTDSVEPTQVETGINLL